MPGSEERCPVCVVAIAARERREEPAGERQACPGCGANLRRRPDDRGVWRWERLDPERSPAADPDR